MKLGNYILEQDISTASCDDIEVAQFFAEMEVVSALLDCYNKQAVITEYASCDIKEFGIFAESGDGDGEAAKKDNVLKRAWTAVIGLFKKIGQMIVKFFTRFKFKTLKEKVSESDVQTYKFSSYVDRCVKQLCNLVAVYNEFGQLLNDVENNGSITTDKSAYEEISKKIDSIEQIATSKISQSYNGDNIKDTMNYPKDKICELLQDLENCQKNEIPGLLKTLKKFDALAAKKLDGETFNVIKECATRLHKNYVTLFKFCDDMIGKIVKPQLKSKTVNEYYTDHPVHGDKKTDEE